jgi:hypothetical protein
MNSVHWRSFVIGGRRFSAPAQKEKRLYPLRPIERSTLNRESRAPAFPSEPAMCRVQPQYQGELLHKISESEIISLRYRAAASSTL